MLQKGFTLIELMIVVAIIGILSMFALPAYQDYTKRTYVSEGMALASGAKLAATEYFSTQGYWPINNVQAGLAAPASITGQSVDAIAIGTDASNDINTDNTGLTDVTNGSITITYNARVAAGSTLVIVSDGATGGSIRWVCSGTNTNGVYQSVGGQSAANGAIQVKWLPSNCREELS